MALSYEPIEVKVMDIRFVDNGTLEEKEAYLFKESFNDKNAKKVDIVMPLDSFFRSRRIRSVKKYS